MKKSVIIALTICLHSFTYAQDFFRDFSFGTLGIAISNFNDNDDALAYTTDMFSNGKIITAGFTNNFDNSDLVIAKYNEDGTYDSSFGENGKVITNLGAHEQSLKFKIIALPDGGALLMSGTNLSGETEVLVLKYNADGSMDVSFNGSGYYISDFGEVETYPTDMIIQEDGKILVVGMRFEGVTYECLTIRLNENGTIDNTFGTDGYVISDFSDIAPHGGNSFEFPFSIGLQSNGNIVIAGYTTDISDSEAYYFMANYLPDGTLNPAFADNGRFITSHDNAQAKYIYRDIAIQDDDKIVYTGYFSDYNFTTEVDESQMVIGRLNTNGSNDLTFNSTGELAISNSLYDFGISIQVQEDGKIIAGGNTMANGDLDFLFVRLNSDGTFDENFGNNGQIISDIILQDYLTDFFVYDDLRVVACGITNYSKTNNFTTGRFFTTCNISGKIFNDENSDGELNETEYGLPHRLVKIMPDELYLNTNSEGMYFFAGLPGTYYISTILQDNWQQISTPHEYDLTYSNQTDYFSDIDFGINAIENIPDVSISITGTNTRAYFLTHYWIDFQNLGTITESGTISITHDTLLTFIDADILPTTQNENLLEWDYNTLVSSENRQLFLTFLCPDVEHIDDTLISICNVTNSGSDINLSNNTDTIIQIVTGSFDPNDKQVSPNGIGEEGFVLHNTELTYTVRFQNTGTDTAFNVVVIDTLSSELNIETMRFIASSHECNYSITTTTEDHKTIIRFSFDNIFLPHEEANEAESHGFVKFSIYPKIELSDYTNISNLAYIYFDFNPPIITNEVSNTFVSTLSNILTSELTHSIYPNPTKGIINIDVPNLNSVSIYTVDGKLLHLYGKTKVVDLSNNDAGTYIIKITSDTKVFFQKVILTD